MAAFPSGLECDDQLAGDTGGTAVRRLTGRSPDSRAESLGGASFGLGRLFFPILGRRGGFERTEETSRHAGYFIHGSLERSLVGFRRLVKTADFSHELQRGSLNLFGSNRRIEVKEGFDIPAHFTWPQGIKTPNRIGTFSHDRAEGRRQPGLRFALLLDCQRFCGYHLCC